MPDEIDKSKLEAYARKLAKARVTACATYLVDKIKQNISIPSRTVTMKAGRGGKMKKVLGPRGSNRSLPGEFPHKDYGLLRASIAWQINDDGAAAVARVGTPLAYGKFLEFGTRRMQARPFLRRTLAEESGRLATIAKGESAT